MIEYLQTFAMLLIVHALCDYPLQGDFMAKAKNPAAPIAGVPWPWPMAMHGLIHAGGVWLVTGCWAFAAAEFALHVLIDMEKCIGLWSFTGDQVAHLVCKAVWATAGMR